MVVAVVEGAREGGRSKGVCALARACTWVMAPTPRVLVGANTFARVHFHAHALCATPPRKVACAAREDYAAAGNKSAGNKRYHKLRRQVTSRRDGSRAPRRDRPVLRDPRSALSRWAHHAPAPSLVGDGPRHTTAVSQLLVGGIHDGPDLLLAQVAVPRLEQHSMRRVAGAHLRERARTQQSQCVGAHASTDASMRACLHIPRRPACFACAWSRERSEAETESGAPIFRILAGNYPVKNIGPAAAAEINKYST